MTVSSQGAAIQGLLRVGTDLFEVRGRCGLPMESSIFSFGRPEIETVEAFSEEEFENESCAVKESEVKVVAKSGIRCRLVAQNEISRVGGQAERPLKTPNLSECVVHLVQRHYHRL
jgi:hypothetical protein